MATSSNNGSTNKDDEKLVAMFYLLMRDATSTGELLRVINLVKEIDGSEAVFSNKHLEAMARDYVARFKGD